MSDNKRVNCFKCKYFYITWDENNPKGCSYFGFKSRQLPSIVVRNSSGKPCEAFACKPEY